MGPHAPGERHAEEIQRAQYDKIGSVYEAHYSDKWSLGYREQFMEGPAVAGLDLRGKKLLDGMCGNGPTAQFMQRLGADVAGVDISAEVLDQFRRRLPDATAVQASMASTGLPSGSFDIVVVTGGLHHVQPHVNEVVGEICRILKPGGYFCFVEPHAHSLPDLARRIWYRIDRTYFETNEAAIDLDAMMRSNETRFEFVSTQYPANIGYLLVLNTMVFRIPVRWKPIYSAALIWLEAVIEPAHGSLLSSFVVA